MKLVSDNATRAERHSPREMNRRILERTRRRVDALAGNPERIRARLSRLDREWDIERCLEVGSATLTLTGLALGAWVHPLWLLLSAGVQGFFLQHAIQGWCPPLPLFRAMGVRTQREIEAERHTLKALLGAYERPADGPASPQRTLEAALS